MHVAIAGQFLIVTWNTNKPVRSQAKACSFAVDLKSALCLPHNCGLPVVKVGISSGSAVVGKIGVVGNTPTTTGPRFQQVLGKPMRTGLMLTMLKQDLHSEIQVDSLVNEAAEDRFALRLVDATNSLAPYLQSVIVGVPGHPNGCCGLSIPH